MRSGADYRAALAAANPEVYLSGDRVDPATHPAFAGAIDSYCRLYDMQVDEANRELLSFEEDGRRFPISHLVPREEADLVRRRAASEAWARFSGGMLGRTSDYLNSALTALGAASEWFAQADPQFATNIANYTRWVRDEDIFATYALVPPQINRSMPPAEQAGGGVSLRIVDEDDEGIIVSGARMIGTSAPISDELLVFPATVLRPGPEDTQYSFAFAIPTDSPGLKFLCRAPLGHGQGPVGEPLAARFEEMDATCIFDRVRVPYERVFLLGHPELANGFYSQTGASVLMAHQVIARTTVKSEFYAGLLLEMADAIGISRFDHIRDDVAQVMMAAQFGRSALRAAEVDGFVNAHGFFQPDPAPLNAVRNWFPRAFHTFSQAVRKFGASGLVALPSAADLGGPAAGDIATYLQSANRSGEDRVRLFRLAFDASVSSFAGRQELYEYFFFGDPLRMASAYIGATDTEPMRQLVRDLLLRDDEAEE